MADRSYRSLPSVDALLKEPVVAARLADLGHAGTVAEIRAVLDEIRGRLKSGSPAPAMSEILRVVQSRLEERMAPSLREVINATGVIIHTNLGRAPLSDGALRAMAAVGGSYSTLEWDLATGKRGSRYDHVAALLAEVSGAEAAVVVNNAAAALVLVLSAFASGREAVMSRAHLIEIGGGFRIPDIMRQSGVTLREVGTTNRTYLRDYTEAVNDQSAMFMRMHSSNFRIEGFVHQPALAELCAAAHEHGLLVVDDLGSGALLDTAAFGLAHEPMVQESIAAGADIVLFSGDKLLGGPQAGCIVGRRALIELLRKHPLIRALRVDKTTLAGLDGTLRSYLRGKATEEIPVWRMISMAVAGIEARARQWVESLNRSGIDAHLLRGHSAVGGGSLPGETLPTWLVAIPSRRPELLAAALRQQRPVIAGRIEGDLLLLDPRTVLQGQDEALLNGLRNACSAPLSAES